jgi:hypothetical protein
VYLKYIKATNTKKYNEDELEAIQQYFEISKKEAKEYISMLPDEEIKSITKQINGK